MAAIFLRLTGFQVIFATRAGATLILDSAIEQPPQSYPSYVCLAVPWQYGPVYGKMCHTCCHVQHQEEAPLPQCLYCQEVDEQIERRHCTYKGEACQRTVLMCGRCEGMKKQVVCQRCWAREWALTCFKCGEKRARTTGEGYGKFCKDCYGRVVPEGRRRRWRRRRERGSSLGAPPS